MNSTTIPSFELLFQCKFLSPLVVDLNFVVVLLMN